MNPMHVNEPAPDDIVNARKAAGLGQLEAGALLGIPQPRWAEYERGVTRMPVARWAMFLLLCDLHPTTRLMPRSGGVAVTQF
jgi:hypothetical protein